jgi:hypothetical protein
MKYIEEDMIAAIEDVHNGMSVRGAAIKHKVSKTIHLLFKRFIWLNFIVRLKEIFFLTFEWISK